MANDIQQKIESLVKNNPIVLFMKGNREQPQCGFSRQVVDVLNQLVSDFHTVDVLADPDIREGIKAYSSWPTLPQLYINAEFIGGCDIVLDLFNKNELQKQIGLEKAEIAPSINVSEKARVAFKNASSEQPGEDIRITVGANFAHHLQFDTKTAQDFVIELGGVNLIIDPYSAYRAQNFSVDFIDEGLEPGFSFKNPSEPPAVQELSVNDLVLMREQKKEFLLIDVRPKNEWLTAHIDFAKRLEEMSPEEIRALDKNALIVFHCHHGGRSLRTAKAWRSRGFMKLYNLSGGIDAWSRQIDKSVPLY